METTANYGFSVPSDDDSDLIDNTLWKTPITQIDTQLKTDKTVVKATCPFGPGFDEASGTTLTPTVYAAGAYVNLVARIKRSSGTGTLAFTVPVGFRPSSQYDIVYLPVLSLNGAGTAAPGFVGVLNVTTGVVTLTQVDNDGAAWNTSTWLHFNSSWLRDGQ